MTIYPTTTVDWEDDVKILQRLLHKKELYLEDKLYPFYKTALRLDLHLKGDSYDIFSADVYYHKTCYLRFAHPYETYKENEVRSS